MARVMDPQSEAMLGQLRTAGASAALLERSAQRLSAGYIEYGPWDLTSRDWVEEQIEEAVDGLHYALASGDEYDVIAWLQLTEALLEKRDHRLRAGQPRGDV